MYNWCSIDGLGIKLMFNRLTDDWWMLKSSLTNIWCSVDGQMMFYRYLTDIEGMFNRDLTDVQQMLIFNGCWMNV